jgi:hypothetical protein
VGGTNTDEEGSSDIEKEVHTNQWSLAASLRLSAD